MKDRLDKTVFNWCWNDRSVYAETTVSSSEFQISEAATGRARLPMVESDAHPVAESTVSSIVEATCMMHSLL